MYHHMRSFAAAAVLLTADGAAGLAAAAPRSSSSPDAANNELVRRLERLELAMDEQRLHYQRLLQQQRHDFERRLEEVELATLIAEVTAVGAGGGAAEGSPVFARERQQRSVPLSSFSPGRRRLIDTTEMSGVSVASDKAAILMGSEHDVGILRTGADSPCACRIGPRARAYSVEVLLATLPVINAPSH